MKKIFQKLNVPQVRSMILGAFVLALVAVTSSHVLAQNNASVPALGEVSQSRIGSLAVGVPNSWFDAVNGRCLAVDNTNEFLGTCLAAGTTALSNLLVSKTGHFLDAVSVGGDDLASSFVIDGLNETLMATELARYINGTFTPRDTTSQVGLCAEPNGDLVRCAETLPSNTYTWVAGDWGECTQTGLLIGAGTRTRLVSCQDQNGNVVDDSFCSDLRPIDTESCSVGGGSGDGGTGSGTIGRCNTGCNSDADCQSGLYCNINGGANYCESRECGTVGSNACC